MWRINSLPQIQDEDFLILNMDSQLKTLMHSLIGQVGKLEEKNEDFKPSPQYLDELNDLTDRFSKRGANALKPNGNPINQVRTNDFIEGDWQMREFNLFSKQAAHDVKAFPDRNTTLKVDPHDPELQSIGLWTTTTKNNPMVKSDPDIRKPLSRWINQRESQILDGDVGPRTPEWMDGPVADEPTSGFTYRCMTYRTNLARYGRLVSSLSWEYGYTLSNGSLSRISSHEIC